MIDEGDCGAIGGMKIGRGNRSNRRKPAPAPFCPPQIPFDQKYLSYQKPNLGCVACEVSHNLSSQEFGKY
jgi:hypothetical protein